MHSHLKQAGPKIPSPLTARENDLQSTYSLVCADTEATVTVLNMDTKAKCRHLKSLPAKGLCGRCLSVWGLSPHMTPYPTPPPLRIVHVYIVYLFTRGEGGELTREKIRGATVHKAGSKVPTWLTVSPVYITLITTWSKVPWQVKFFRWRHFALVSI